MKLSHVRRPLGAPQRWQLACPKTRVKTMRGPLVRMRFPTSTLRGRFGPLAPPCEASWGPFQRGLARAGALVERIPLRIIIIPFESADCCPWQSPWATLARAYGRHGRHTTHQEGHGTTGIWGPGSGVDCGLRAALLIRPTQPCESSDKKSTRGASSHFPRVSTVSPSHFT